MLTRTTSPAFSALLAAIGVAAVIGWSFALMALAGLRRCVRTTMFKLSLASCLLAFFHVSCGGNDTASGPSSPDGGGHDDGGSGNGEGGAERGGDAGGEAGALDASTPLDAGPALANACPPGKTCSECSVHFDQKARTIDPRSVNSCISTYGQTVATSGAQRTSLSQLSLGRYRIPIQWNNGNPISSARGGPQNINADDYVKAVQAMGAEVVVVIGGKTSDMDFTAGDAANLVAHYTAMGVTTFYVGNEPGNAGMSIDNYAALFNSAADAMRAKSANIKIGGPTWAYYDKNLLDHFLDLSGTKLDILDYHHYAMGNPPALSDADALIRTKNWGDEVAALYASLAQKGLTGRQVSVGEYNWAWQYNDGVAGGDTRFFEPIVSVWAASVIGHILSSGGLAFQYSDENGPLGLTVQKGNNDQGQPQSAPQPIYHGLGMWTGEKLFRSFGTDVLTSSCVDPNIEIYATSGPNVLVINKSTATKDVILTWNPGSGHAVSVWQTNGSDGYAAPTKVGVGGADPTAIYLSLPQMTVTTLVVE